MTGFVTDYAQAIKDNRAKKWHIAPGTTENWIMGCYSSETLPVLSALARGFAVCDPWFGSVPTETMPNRAFTSAGTSQGHMDDVTKSYTVPSIFGLLGKHGIAWRIYGYDKPPLTRLNFPDTQKAPAVNIGLFKDFTADAAAGALPAFSFVEQSWSSTGNTQHPNYSMAAGEHLILDTYRALRSGPGWAKTLLILIYDERGGCYDHVSPPSGATSRTAPPGSSASTSPASDRVCRPSS